MTIAQPASSRWWLVRHGESTWNVEGRLQGQTMDVPLTDRGRTQAAAAAELIRQSVGGDVRIVASDQLRAADTAAIIAAALGVGVVHDARLREQSLGEMEGRLASELAPLPTPEGSHISEIRWGGGESVADVHARCRDFVAAQPAAGDLVVVSHGDTLRVMLAVLAGIGHRDVDWRPIGSAEVIGPISPR